RTASRRRLRAPRKQKSHERDREQHARKQTTQHNGDVVPDWLQVIERRQKPQYVMAPEEISKEFRDTRGDRDVPRKKDDTDDCRVNKEPLSVDSVHFTVKPTVSDQRRNEQDQSDWSLGQNAQAASESA